MLYGIYRELSTLELVAFVKATSYEEAAKKAMVMGYGKEYRIEEEDE